MYLRAILDSKGWEEITHVLYIYIRAMKVLGGKKSFPRYIMYLMAILDNSVVWVGDYMFVSHGHS